MKDDFVKIYKTSLKFKPNKPLNRSFILYEEES